MNESLVNITLKDLINLANQAKKIRIKRTKIIASNSGGYYSKTKGRGMEFDEARLYQAGDDIRQIDWKITARTGKTHTKLFREEKEKPVIISLDKRPTMNFATRGVFKSVQAAKVAGLLAWSCQMAGDKVGGQVFNNSKCKELKPRSGKVAALRFFNLILQLEEDETESKNNFYNVIKRLAQHTNPGTQIYIISDFRGLNQETEFLISKIAKNCDISFIHIYDNLEKEFPKKGRYRLVNDNKFITLDSNNKFRDFYQKKYQTKMDYLIKLTNNLQIKLFNLNTTQNPIDIIF